MNTREILVAKLTKQICVLTYIIFVGVAFLFSPQFLQPALLNPKPNLTPLDTNGTHGRGLENIMTPDLFLKLDPGEKQFTKYQHNFPCVPISNNKEGTGLIYIKVFKTASSTVSHIVKNIGRKRGCKQQSDHAAAHTLNLQNRKQNQSFLFTFVREPTKRAISNFFYFKVTMQNQEVSVSNFKSGCCKSRMKLKGNAGFQLAYISTQGRLPEYSFWNSSDPEKIQNPYKLLDRINHVFKSYNFIGVSERLNESMVVLSFLLDLTVREIAYVNHKNSGSYVYVRSRKECVKIVEAQLPRELEEYLTTKEWNTLTAGDTLLHRTAWKALDNTIDNVIGRDLFQKRLKQYESLMEMMHTCNEKCLDCSSDGKYHEPTSCSSCMDKIVSSS